MRDQVCTFWRFHYVILEEPVEEEAELTVSSLMIFAAFWQELEIWSNSQFFHSFGEQFPF